MSDKCKITCVGHDLTVNAKVVFYRHRDQLAVQFDGKKIYMRYNESDKMFHGNYKELEFESVGP